MEQNEHNNNEESIENAITDEEDTNSMEEEDSDGDEESLSNSQNVSLIKNQMVIIQRSLITDVTIENQTQLISLLSAMIIWHDKVEKSRFTDNSAEEEEEEVDEEENSFFSYTMMNSELVSYFKWNCLSGILKGFLNRFVTDANERNRIVQAMQMSLELIIRSFAFSIYLNHAKANNNETNNKNEKAECETEEEESEIKKEQEMLLLLIADMFNPEAKFFQSDPSIFARIYFDTFNAFDDAALNDRVNNANEFASSPRYIRSSDNFVQVLNFFGSRDGFLIFSKLIHIEYLSVSAIYTFLAGLFKARKYLNEKFVWEFITGIYPPFFSSILCLNETDFKAIPTQQLEHSIEIISNFLQAIDYKPPKGAPNKFALSSTTESTQPSKSESFTKKYHDLSANLIVDAFKLDLALKCLRSHAFDKRFQALKLITTLFKFAALTLNSRMHRKVHVLHDSDDEDDNYFSKSLSTSYLLNWLQSNDILERELFGDRMHAGLIPRTEDIFLFLTQANALSNAHINLLWNAAIKGSDEVVDAIFTIFTELIPHLNKAFTLHLFRQIAAVPREKLTTAILNLLHTLTLHGLQLAAAKNETSEVYGVEIYWQVLQDKVSCTLSEDIVAVSYALLRKLLERQRCRFMLFPYMKKCIKNLEYHDSVPQSLGILTKIIEEWYSLDDEDIPITSLERATKGHLVYLLLTSKNLEFLFFKDLQLYKERAYAALKNGIKSGKIKESADVDKLKLIENSRQTHHDHVATRLEFMKSMILITQEEEVGRVPVAITSIDKFWNSTMLCALSPTENKATYAWISAAYCILQYDAVARLLCNMNTTVNFADLTSEGFECYHKLFWEVNCLRESVIEDLFIVEPPHLLYGFSELVDVVLNVKNSVVATASQQYLLSLYDKIDDSIVCDEEAIHSSFVHLIMERIREELINSNYFVLARCVVVLKSFVEKFSNCKDLVAEAVTTQSQSANFASAITGNRNDLTLSSQKYTFTLHLISPDMDDEPLILSACLPITSSVNKLRETIGEQLGVAGKNIKLQHAMNPAFYGNALCEVGMDGSETIFFRIMEDGECDSDDEIPDLQAIETTAMDSSADSTEVEVTDIQLQKREAAEKASVTPKELLASNQEFFDRLFLLLRIPQEKIATRTWDLISMLPVNESVFYSIKNTNWKVLLASDSNSNSSFALLYTLRIISSIVTGVGAEEWQLQFIACGGLTTLFEIFTTTFSSDDVPSEQRAQVNELYSHLLTLLQLFFLDNTDTCFKPEFLSEKVEWFNFEKLSVALFNTISNIAKSIESDEDGSATHSDTATADNEDDEVLTETENEKAITMASSLLFIILDCKPELLRKCIFTSNAVNFQIFFANCLLHTQKLNIRKKIALLVLSMCERDNSKTIAKHFLIILTQMLAEVRDKQHSTTPIYYDQYFNVIRSLIMQYVSSANAESQHSIVCSTGEEVSLLGFQQRLIQYIKDSASLSPSFLVGLLETLLTLVTSVPKCSTEAKKCNLPYLVLHDCLFEIPTIEHSATSFVLDICTSLGTEKSDKKEEKEVGSKEEEDEKDVAPVLQKIECLLTNDSTQTPPKCKDEESRQAAYKLLTTLCSDKATSEIVFAYFKTLLAYLPIDSKKQLVMQQVEEKGVDNINTAILQQHQEYNRWNYEPNTTEKSELGFVGIKNLSCICYMNSLMQQFFMMPPFRQKMLQLQIDNTAKESEIVTEMQLLLAYLQESQKQYYDPTKFCSVNTDYSGAATDVTIQMDANEYFNRWCEQMEEGLKHTPQKQLLQNFCAGELVTLILSDECEHTSESKQPFHTATLEIKFKKNLQNAMESYCKSEELVGDNAYKCESCNKKVNASLRRCFNKLPDTLILHLMRFAFDLELMQKNKVNDYCEFPLTLDMYPYTKEGLLAKDGKQVEKKNDEYYQYQLVGVLIHSGIADSGHYYSFIKERFRPNNQEPRWLEFNDEIVRPFDLANLAAECFGGKEIKQNQFGMQMEMEKSKSAYMLIYERVQPQHPQQLTILKEIKQQLNNINSSTSQMDNSQSVWKAPIPKDLYCKVWNENSNFVLDKALFHKQCSSFMLSCLKQIAPDPNEDVSLMSMDELEQLKASIKQTAPTVKVAIDYLFRVLCRSKDKSAITDYVNTLINIMYHRDRDTCYWTMNNMLENGPVWLEKILLASYCEQTRQAIASLITCCFSSLSIIDLMTVDEQTIEEAEEGILVSKVEDCASYRFPNQFSIIHDEDSKMHQPIDLVIDEDVPPTIRIIELLFCMVRRLPANWTRFSQFFYIFNDIVQTGHKSYRHYLIQREVVVCFVDLMLGCNSPTTTKYFRKYNFGDKNNKPPYYYLAAFLSAIIRGAEFGKDDDVANNNNTADNDDDGDDDDVVIANPYALPSPPVYVPDHIVQLIVHDKVVTKMILDEMNLEETSKMLCHICWRSNSMSNHFLNMLCKKIHDAEYYTLVPWFKVIAPILCISDCFQESRINLVMSSVLKTITSFKKFHKFTKNCVQHWLDICLDNEMTLRWLLINKQEWLFVEQWMCNNLVQHREIGYNCPSFGSNYHQFEDEEEEEEEDDDFYEDGDSDVANNAVEDNDDDDDDDDDDDNDDGDGDDYNDTVITDTDI